MKKILFLILSFISANVFANGSSIETLRSLMSEAFKKETAALSFHQNTRSISPSSPALLLGFKAISEFMMCNHIHNPFTQLSYFKKGKNLLEQAILRDATNIELRFMRFCTQVSTPSILAYNDDIAEDKNLLIQYLKAQQKLKIKDDEALFVNMKGFLLESTHCTQEEKSILKNL
jgi:hypothetical protein